MKKMTQWIKMGKTNKMRMHDKPQDNIVKQGLKSTKYCISLIEYIHLFMNFSQL